jgi:hypothetical protein
MGMDRPHSPLNISHRSNPMCCYIRSRNSAGSSTSVRRNNVSTNIVLQLWAWQTRDQPRQHQCDISTDSPIKIPTIANPTRKMNMLAVNHACPITLVNQPHKQIHSDSTPTQTMPTGPVGREKERVDAIEGTRPMMLKAIAKTCRVEYCRRSSCL